MNNAYSRVFRCLLGIAIISICGSTAAKAGSQTAAKPAFPSNPSSSETKIRAPAAHDADCAYDLGRPNDSMFVYLKSVTLVFDLTPSKYVYALNCHGQEKVCLDSDGSVKDAPERRSEELKSLLDAYHQYPIALHPQNVIGVFSKMLKRKVMPFAASGPHCAIPDPIVLNLAGEHIDEGGTLRDAMKSINNTPGMLTYAVRVWILDTATPHIAILTSGYYRPDRNRGVWWEMRATNSTAIPLDLADDEIEKRLETFANSLQIWTNKEAQQ